jgi:serine/threonine-protein kinase
MDEESIFLVALQKPTPEEQAAYLDAACAGNAELRRSVEMLLRAHERAGEFLQVNPRGLRPTVDEAVPERPGTVIGPYKLLEQIGEGGFGVVFLAEQTHPVRRQAALKVLKPGMDTRQVIARFEAERQALALMDHPNIAKVLDAGTIPLRIADCGLRIAEQNPQSAIGNPQSVGRLFFVMELVKGIPITDYCDQYQLTTRERLDLFLSVCHAVQHAHQKGVIHRDIKPSNVLVAIQDGQPMVKVIDLGVAKAINQRLSEHTLVTGFHQMIGTPLYMSPEQAEMSPLDVDTRADIYSLGVLLYELLTGTTPFEKERLSQVSYDELRRIIREEEPPRPSTRLSTLKDNLTTVATQRRTEPRQLLRTVRGELDWIVMKCLEKDRNRRYETANGLAMDVQRYLNDEHVLACPPSVEYRLRKFVRRNKRALVVAVVLGVALLVAVGAVAGSMGWAARDRAARQAVLEQRVAQALDETEDFYKRDKLPEAVAAVKRAEGLLASGGGSEELQQRVDRWRADLKMVARLEAIRLERVAFKDEGFDTAGTDLAYRSAFQEYGLDVEALDPDEAAERIRASAIKDTLVTGLDAWMGTKGKEEHASYERLRAIGLRADTDPWRRRFREAYQRRDWKALVALAQDKEALRQPSATAAFMRAVLKVLGEDSLAHEILREGQRRYPGDFWINFDLAKTLEHMTPPQLGEAVGFYRAALALRPESPVVHLGLGNVLRRLDRLADAEAAYREAVRLQPEYAAAHANLGHVLLEQDKWDQAESAFRETLRLKTKSVAHVGLKPESVAHVGLGNLRSKQGKLAEAVAEYRKALDIEPGDAVAHYNLGNALYRQGRWAEAEAAYRESLRLQPNDAESHCGLGIALGWQGKPAQAEVEFRKAIHLKPDYALAHYSFGVVLRQQGKFGDAAAAFREGIRLKPDYAEAHQALGEALRAQGKLPEAAAAHREAIRLKADFAEAHYGLGATLHQQDKHAQAETEFRQAIHLRADHANAHYGLGSALRYQGRWEESIAAYEQAVRLKPDYAQALGFLAKVLANCPEVKYRNPPRAVEAAKKAVELDRQSSWKWQSLGWAQYRAGDWEASIEALEKSIALQTSPKGGDPWQWFFLAMAHWQLGNQAEARKWYDQAAQWMEKHAPNNDELRRFQAEAAALLKIEEKPKSKPESK